MLPLDIQGKGHIVLPACSDYQHAVFPKGKIRLPVLVKREQGCIAMTCITNGAGHQYGSVIRHANSIAFIERLRVHRDRHSSRAE